MSDTAMICITVAICWLSTLAVLSQAIRRHERTNVTVVKKVEVRGK